MKSLTLFALCAAASVFNSYAQQSNPAKLAVKWALVDKIENASSPLSKIIIENKGATAVDLKNYDLYFNFMQRIHADAVDKKYKIQHRNGDFYQLSFQDPTSSLKQQDTLEIFFKVNGRFINFTDGPAGFYLQHKVNKDDIIEILDRSVQRLPLTDADRAQRLANQYTQNQRIQEVSPQPVLPTVKSYTAAKGTFQFSENLSIYSDAAFDLSSFETAFNAAFSLKIQTAKTANKATISLQKDASLGKEAYTLTINKQGIQITASTDIGAFYAIQTLRSLADSKGAFAYASIQDEPRFPYRGLSVDAARNFHSKEEILKIIDLMARYKLNKFHFHFSDDEGWRLEIPSLPELTQVGSMRGAAFEKNQMLQPSYNLGAYAKDKQFYTVTDFVEILRYATARHIQVIPEVETPGHARAAIKSMEYRYQRLMAEGSPEKAAEFRLVEPTDASVYSSAQHWSDNVMNPALPATYHFLDVVLQDIAKMYKLAQVPFEQVSLGGDETPKGSWAASPAVLALMKTQKFESVFEVWPYYIDKINQLCQQHKLSIAGWEEMGMKNSGKGMQVNPDAKLTNIQLDVWNNSIGWGQEDLAYKLANAGYPVVFTSATHNYFDLTWNADFEEPGHWWAGKINIDRTYGFIPNNFYINIDQKVHGEAIPADYFKDKVHLTEAGKKNMLGIKAALWSEKITNPERLEYMLFPRVLALAERAWSPERNWELGNTFNKQAYEKDFSAFMQKLGKSELPKLDTFNNGYAYRLPVVGAKVEENLIYVNTDYPGFQVYYTVDGSEPSLSSPRYTKPLAQQKGKTYKFRVITPQGRGGNTATLNL